MIHETYIRHEEPLHSLNRQIIIMKTGCYSVILFLMTSCIGDGMTNSQREYINNLKHYDLTPKELNFQDSLRKMKYTNVKFDTPIIGYVCQGCSSYTVQMDCPFVLSDYNKDSIKQANFEMAKHLYSNVIEDSIIYDMGDVTIEYSAKKSGVESSGKYLNGTYPKRLLEKELRFKVVKTSDGKFKRMSNGFKRSNG